MLTVTTTQSHSHGVINGRLVRALSRCFQTLNVPLSVGPERTWISIDFNAIPSARYVTLRASAPAIHSLLFRSGRGAERRRELPSHWITEPRAAELYE